MKKRYLYRVLFLVGMVGLIVVGYAFLPLPGNLIKAQTYSDSPETSTTSTPSTTSDIPGSSTIEGHLGSTFDPKDPAEQFGRDQHPEANKDPTVKKKSGEEIFRTDIEKMPIPKLTEKPKKPPVKRPKVLKDELDEETAPTDEELTPKLSAETEEEEKEKAKEEEAEEELPPEVTAWYRLNWYFEQVIGCSCITLCREQPGDDWMGGDPQL